MLAQLYGFGLGLFPFDFRSRFAWEMRAAFDPRHGARELSGLVTALTMEWVAKVSADPARRGRHLPDCRMMRPVGVTRAQWARGIDGCCRLLGCDDDDCVE